MTHDDSLCVRRNQAEMTLSAKNDNTPKAVGAKLHSQQKLSNSYENELSLSSYHIMNKQAFISSRKSQFTQTCYNCVCLWKIGHFQINAIKSIFTSSVMTGSLNILRFLGNIFKSLDQSSIEKVPISTNHCVSNTKGFLVLWKSRCRTLYETLFDAGLDLVPCFPDRI